LHAIGIDGLAKPSPRAFKPDRSKQLFCSEIPPLSREFFL
jgi:hypothetical protein